MQNDTCCGIILKIVIFKAPAPLLVCLKQKIRNNVNGLMILYALKTYPLTIPLLL